MLSIYLTIFITLLAALIVSLAQLTFKKATNKRKITNIKSIFQFAFSKLGIIGILGYFGGLAVYLLALKNAPLALVYPIFSSTFVFVTLISVFALKESFGSKRAIGISLIVIGIILVALSL
jgi:uncharacterized membrane protein